MFTVDAGDLLAAVIGACALFFTGWAAGMSFGHALARDQAAQGAARPSSGWTALGLVLSVAAIGWLATSLSGKAAKPPPSPPAPPALAVAPPAARPEPTQAAPATEQDHLVSVTEEPMPDTPIAMPSAKPPAAPPAPDDATSREAAKDAEFAPPLTPSRPISPAAGFKRVKVIEATGALGVIAEFEIISVTGKEFRTWIRKPATDIFNDQVGAVLLGRDRRILCRQPSDDVPDVSGWERTRKGVVRTFRFKLACTAVPKAGLLRVPMRFEDEIGNQYVAWEQPVTIH